MNEIDKYIKEKEKWLKKEEIKTIKNIIYNDLSEDIEKAFVDLIYCIEISITNEYVDEQEIMPIFYKLYGMRNELYKVKAIDLENIQKEVKEIINIK
jgi:hypothetical protein